MKFPILSSCLWKLNDSERRQCVSIEGGEGFIRSFRWDGGWGGAVYLFATWEVGEPDSKSLNQLLINGCQKHIITTFGTDSFDQFCWLVIFVPKFSDFEFWISVEAGSNLSSACQPMFSINFTMAIKMGSEFQYCNIDSWLAYHKSGMFLPTNVIFFPDIFLKGPLDWEVFSKANIVFTQNFEILISGKSKHFFRGRNSIKLIETQKRCKCLLNAQYM